ncbi:hypothetical protein IC229_21930 [Spirosoma sp. BT702]|uniref:Uncharacterized protein n=1 Tax=Spirosoma profusum TaxID=2771354 RepID=A0A927ATE6_9BACT|nr:hypothetical protein [Spirosoma profusum]MBD2703320.1 hypothetical protein [Spirosoma profusum]
MTPKQRQRLEKKIADVKRVLAAEKRKFGGYDDSRGLRYLPTRYYIQLADYPGGLTYLRWFAKTFPDDIGFPDFLFERAILLFKSGKLAEAKVKVWQTFCANTYVLDNFFGQPIHALPKYEWSTMAQIGFTAHFPYTHQQADLLDMSPWLAEFIVSDTFSARKARYLTLHQQLLVEEDDEIRGYLHQEVEVLESHTQF